MSIITTIYVPEGIAMAADSRLTRTKDLGNGTIEIYSLSDNNQKIFLISKANVGISTCGNAFIGGKTIADFIRIFEIEKVTIDDNVTQVASNLHKYLQDFADSNGLHFHVAGYLDDEPYLYTIDLYNIKRMNISESSTVQYGACWSGAQEAINKLLNSEPIMATNFDLMPLKDAADYAEFLVSTTINYQRYIDRPAVCGGPIDVLVITKDAASFIKHKLFKPY